MRGPVFCTTNTLKNRKSVLNIHTHYLAIVDLASRSHHHGKQHQRRHAATTRAEVATSRRKQPTPKFSTATSTTDGGTARNVWRMESIDVLQSRDGVSPFNYRFRMLRRKFVRAFWWEWQKYDLDSLRNVVLQWWIVEWLICFSSMVVFQVYCSFAWWTFAVLGWNHCCLVSCLRCA